MAKLKHTFKTDILFKLLFVTHQDLLKQLVAQLLGIPLESIGEFLIANPEMPPESLGSKFCRLDIHMVVNGQRVNLEVQVENEGNYRERVLFNWARVFSSALPAGDDYSLLPRTIIASIINFKQFECSEFYSEFQPLELTRHTPLSDKATWVFFELPKLPATISADDELKVWLALFKAETEEDLAKIRELGVPVMEQAISAYNSIVVSPEFKEIERLREKAQHDEAQALKNERRKEATAIAKKMLKRGRPVDEIIEDTGLTRKEVEALRDAGN